MVQPLAVAGQSSAGGNTNLSTSIFLTLVNENGTDILFHVNGTEPIELLIPRDPNSIVSLLNWERKTTQNGSNRTMHMHFLNLARKADLEISVHLEIRPLVPSTAYWLVFRFDDPPQINSTSNLTDGWSLLCPFRQTRSVFLVLKYSVLSCIY